MTALINASTSSGVVVTSDTSGSLAFQSNGTTIATVTPTGMTTQVGSPAFFAYQTTGTSLPNGTYAKVLFDTKAFDTNTNYSTSTSKFTPTVAGYYQVNCIVGFSSYVTSEVVLEIAKNGSAYAYPVDAIFTRAYEMSGTTLVYMNGSTDYLEVYAYQNSGGAITTQSGSTAYTAFSASMVRSA